MAPEDEIVPAEIIEPEVAPDASPPADGGSRTPAPLDIQLPDDQDEAIEGRQPERSPPGRSIEERSGGQHQETQDEEEHGDSV